VGKVYGFLYGIKKMSKIKQIIKEKAIQVLIKECRDESELRRKQHNTLARWLKLKYPDGSKPRTKYEWLQALKSWYNTGNRIVLRPISCEIREEKIIERIAQTTKDARLLSSAAANAAKYVKYQNKESFLEANNDRFLRTYEWKQIRLMALKKYGAKCMCCGATPESGAIMNVDHIKPRKLFPSLALDIDNLQVLCHECNHGKGNWDMTDWRTDNSQLKENV
jgi:hypothetical protein